MQIDDTVNPKLLGDYRFYVGAEDYDKTSKMIFGHLLEMGLREDMQVLDMGAGSLRVGRWLIAFLQPGHYTGVEPEEMMVRIGLRENLPSELIEHKKPKFFYFQIQTQPNPYQARRWRIPLSPPPAQPAPEKAWIWGY